MIKASLFMGSVAGVYLKVLFGLLNTFPQVPASFLFWASFPLVLLVAVLGVSALAR